MSWKSDRVVTYFTGTACIDFIPCGKLCVIYCEYYGENWPCYNPIALCLEFHPCTTTYTVYPKKYAHSFVVLCFVVVMQSFIMNSHEIFIHIHQGCFAGTGAIVRLPQCQWSKPDGYGKISQCITTTKHSKAKTVCIFLGIYCMACVSTQCISTWLWVSWLWLFLWNI